jgi:hypothetical protein
MPAAAILSITGVARRYLRIHPSGQVALVRSVHGDIYRLGTEVKRLDSVPVYGSAGYIPHVDEAPIGSDDCRYGFDEDLGVQEQGPTSYVVNVALDPRLESWVRTGRYLP